MTNNKPAKPKSYTNIYVNNRVKKDKFNMNKNSFTRMEDNESGKLNMNDNGNEKKKILTVHHDNDLFSVDDSVDTEE